MKKNVERKRILEQLAIAFSYKIEARGKAYRNLMGYSNCNRKKMQKCC